MIDDWTQWSVRTATTTATAHSITHFTKLLHKLNIIKAVHWFIIHPHLSAAWTQYFYQFKWEFAVSFFHFVMNSHEKKINSIEIRLALILWARTRDIDLQIEYTILIWCSASSMSASYEIFSERHLCHFKDMHVPPTQWYFNHQNYQQRQMIIIIVFFFFCSFSSVQKLSRLIHSRLNASNLADTKCRFTIEARAWFWSQTVLFSFFAHKQKNHLLILHPSMS